MKTLLLFFIPLFLISISSNSQCTRTANFQNGDYVVTGTSTLEFTIEGNKLLKIINLSTMSGPDLHVYLTNSTSITTSASDTPPSGTVDLGLLSGVMGDSNYMVPSEVNINDYTYVVIQCKEFNAFWGFSQLGAQQGGDCTSLSVADVDFQSTRFYPNPATDRIAFTSNYQNEMEVNIYNSFGSLIIVDEYVNPNKKEISTRELSAGIYFVEIVSDEKSLIKKLIIQ